MPNYTTNINSLEDKLPTGKQDAHHPSRATECHIGWGEKHISRSNSNLKVEW